VPSGNGRSIEWSEPDRTSFQEHLMADVAFVVTTIAVFALVALLVRAVAEL
jgi:hypothetical protein